MTSYSGMFIRAGMLSPGVSFTFPPTDLGWKILKTLLDPHQGLQGDASSGAHRKAGTEQQRKKRVT